MHRYIDPAAQDRASLLAAGVDLDRFIDGVIATADAVGAKCRLDKKIKISSVVCARRPTIGVCPSLWGRILCVDVDPHGVTLMHVGGRETTTIHVAFERVPATDREITAILVDLAQRSAPARPSRI